MQNGFNGKLRDEKLNDTLFSSLHQARAELAKWRNDYNYPHPHSLLGWLTTIRVRESRNVCASKGYGRCVN
jgi:transposase InsO family protein